MAFVETFLLWLAPSLFAQETLPNLPVQQTDTVLILGLAATIATVLTATITSIATVLIARLNAKATRAAEEVERVKQTLQVGDMKIVRLQEVADDTHTLVNSSMGLQLRQHAALTKRMAAMTKRKEDKQAAEEAAAMLSEHEDQQRIVDDRAAQRADKEPGTIGEMVSETSHNVKDVQKDVKGLVKQGVKEGFKELAVEVKRRR